MVAMQIAQLTPLIREGILLCYAKKPGDPDTLRGDKQRMAHRIYTILSDPGMVYKFHTAAIITKEIFMPIYDAAGQNHHTNFGGSGGLLATYQEVLDKLESMVQEDESGKVDECTVNRDFFQTVFDVAIAESDDPVVLKSCKRHIVRHVLKVKDVLKERFANFSSFFYRVAHVTEEEWRMMAEHECYLKVPTKEAVAAAKALLQEWDEMAADAKAEMPAECTRLFDRGILRRQLEEFSMGEINDVTEAPEPYRKWRELAEHLVHFFEFRWNSSAYVEGRFSVASNAARTKPASTTRTMSQHVRRHSNGQATAYPTMISFLEIDPTWAGTGDHPELPTRLQHRDVSRQYSFQDDYERLGSKAKELELTLRGKYTAEFLTQFQQQHGQQEEGQEEVPVQRRSTRSRAGQARRNPDYEWSEGEEQQHGGRSVESDEEQDQQQEEEQQQDAGDSEDEDPDDRPLCFLPGRPEQAPAAAEPKTWRKGEKEKQFDDWGNVVPDDDPLASYKADYVWESPDGCHTVCFHDPIKKPPQNSAALGEHGGELSEYQFYSRMKVVNDQGKNLFLRSEKTN